MKHVLSLLALSLISATVIADGQHSSESSVPGHGMQKMAGESVHRAEKDQGAAVGRAGHPSKVTRTISITMDDTMRFTPSEISVKAGETIRFTVKNSGQVPHEMVLGSVADLKMHAAMMRNMPAMHHAETNMITLKPGQGGDLIWEFGQRGSVDIACLIPGHLEAGMVGKITVN